MRCFVSQSINYEEKRIEIELGNIFITFVIVKYNGLFRILKKEGWYVSRQKGSHVIMKHRNNNEQLTVPFHFRKEVKKGMLESILKQAGIKRYRR